MLLTDPVTLHGAHAVLQPLDPSQHEELIAAVHDGELWKLWYTAIPRPEGMRAEIESEFEGGFGRCPGPLFFAIVSQLLNRCSKD